MKCIRLQSLCIFALWSFVARAASLPLAEEGRQIFAASCSVGYCHGVDGAAGKGPRLRDRTWSRTYLHDTIEMGIPGSSMPAWKGRLSEHSIEAVVAYVLSIGKEQGKDQTDVSGTTEAASSKPAISQDAALGRLLFFDLTKDRNCGVCHRIDESGTAIARPFRNVGEKSEQDLVAKTLNAPTTVTYLRVITADGETICGVKDNNGAGLLRIYDVAGAGPPVLRTFDPGSIQKRGQCTGINVHRENTHLYTKEELFTIARFLKSSGEPRQ